MAIVLLGKRICKLMILLHLAPIMTEEATWMSKGKGGVGRAGDTFSLFACMTCLFFLIAWVFMFIVREYLGIQMAFSS